MSPSYWGPSTWLFMHTLASKIKESSFPLIGPNLIMILVKICNNLPCPECAQHAKMFWANVKTANIKTKTDLINLMFVFHNMVNKRKQLPMFRHDNIGYEEDDFVYGGRRSRRRKNRKTTKKIRRKSNKKRKTKRRKTMRHAS